jgi:hypothetical protein
MTSHHQQQEQQQCPSVTPVLLLPKDVVLDRLQAMMVQESSSYHYESYFPPHWTSIQIQESHRINMAWREKICQWSYSVVDHFDLPREVVAISLGFFDRYLATRADHPHSNSGNLALLASLTTLHIAIKVHAPVDIKLSTLASLSRGQFGPQHIEQMEWQIMGALGWKLHPPTLFAFVSYFLMLFHNEPVCSIPPVHHAVRKELFEVAIYMAELSVCDSYFVPFPASVVAMAALSNVMDNPQIMSPTKLNEGQRLAFWNLASSHLGFCDGYHYFPDDDAASLTRHYQLQAAKDRLRTMYAAATAPGVGDVNGTDATMANDGAEGSSLRGATHPQQHNATTTSTLTSSPTSTTEMAEDGNTIASSMDGSCARTSSRMQETAHHHHQQQQLHEQRYYPNNAYPSTAAVATTTSEVEGISFRYSPSPPNQYNNRSSCNTSNSLAGASTTSSSSHSRGSYRYLSSSSPASRGRMTCSPIVAEMQ